MTTKPLLPVTAAIAALGVAPLTQAYEISPLLNIYGSLNLGIEYRMLEDINGQDLGYEDHFEIQDAYSGIGIKGVQLIQDGISVFYDFGLALDTTNGKLAENPQTSWEGPDLEENVAKVGVVSDFGTVSVGRMWNAYYNRVAYTTDHFSSGWTGFDTYAPFQLNRMLTYQSPELDGFSFAVNIKIADSKREDAEQDRYIAAATYQIEKTTLNLGFDSVTGGTDLLGMSVAQGLGAFTLSGKLEWLANGKQDGDDATLITLLLEYAAGKNLFKFHVADGDYPGYIGVRKDSGSEIGVGMDHYLTEQFYVFAEFHHSDDYCAYDLTEADGNGSYTNGVAGIACDVLSVGSHYSF